MALLANWHRWGPWKLADQLFTLLVTFVSQNIDGPMEFGNYISPHPYFCIVILNELIQIVTALKTASLSFLN